MENGGGKSWSFVEDYLVKKEYRAMQRFLGFALIEGHAINITDPFASKNIEGTADGHVHFSVAEGLGGLEVLQVSCAAGVSERNFSPLPQISEQALVHSVAFSFDIDGMN